MASNEPIIIGVDLGNKDTTVQFMRLNGSIVRIEETALALPPVVAYTTFNGSKIGPLIKGK